MKHNQGTKTKLHSGHTTRRTRRICFTVALTLVVIAIISVPFRLSGNSNFVVKKHYSSPASPGEPLQSSPTSKIDSYNYNEEEEAGTSFFSLSPPLNVENKRKNNGEGEEERVFKSCDVSRGEWVRNEEAPYYTNDTCWAILEHQNCMKYGRPDTDFLKWRWKPFGCNLPVFNSSQFLEIVRGKSMAFVGDSVARNQMQSLICLLSRVEYPDDISNTSDFQFKRFRYPTYNFTLAMYWSPYLVKAREVDPNIGQFNLYLDEFDERWTTQVGDFDYIIISAGHWFSKPLIYYENNNIVGCKYCSIENVPFMPHYGYRKAFQTAFKAINGLENYKGVTFLRTFAPSHVDNGTWDNGGSCTRTSPFRSNETTMEGDNLELYTIQTDEFKAAELEGRRKDKKFRLLDTTLATLLRPDGHPGRFGPWAKDNKYSDCVNWCLPGPIDSWNDFLLHMLKMEEIRSSQYKLFAADTRKLMLTSR